MSENGLKLDTILQGDCIQLLKTLPDASIDLIFADPPYFMQTEGELLRGDGSVFDGVSDEWDKFASFSEYDVFSTAWLFECRRVLKNTGSIWVIGSFQNIYRLGFFMQELGFWVLNDIVWEKSNPAPNFNGTRFCNAHETLLWCSKSKSSKYTFNYKTMKELNGGKQDRSVWTIPLCTGSERLKDDDGIKLHATQKPERLLEKVILSSTKEGDVVLDPFFGTGTTGAVAKRYKRHFIGIERDEKYIKYAKKRLAGVESITTKYSSGELEIKPPRVSLKELVDAGLLKADEVLYNKAGEEICRLCEKNPSRVSDGEDILSIHKMAAKHLGRENYNGWQYFYIRRAQDEQKISPAKQSILVRQDWQSTKAAPAKQNALTKQANQDAKARQASLFQDLDLKPQSPNQPPQDLDLKPQSLDEPLPNAGGDKAQNDLISLDSLRYTYVKSKK